MMREVEKRVSRMLAGVRQAFRGVISGVNTDGPVVMVRGEGLAGESGVDEELFQHYGYTSAPPAGTMKIVVPIGGKTSHSIVVATEHAQYRVKALKDGEVAIYTDEGDSIVLSRGRVINIKTKTLNIEAEDSVNFKTPTVNMDHALNVAEQITGKGGLSMSGGDGAHIDNLRVDLDVVIGNKSFNGHKHPETGSITDTPVV
ncbi:TPA: phage baseplate assembly protein [Burkholderia vietnamiensis]|jgi:phage baseplate assembly protein V|uniref:Phage baseplate assembly protein V n=2 Tax=Burkholderia TaxID=32008 RepID=A4JDE7_BURVG|nr:MULTISPECIES: phage baseplate assembly protein V [Burkholderia cepacia complex]ABO54300.1 phage baseplate assembly protein V [Burkholderia vietnamiensis G4]KVE13226.1 phage baseplate protein [Burkholderia vietnamiensis]KVF35370.1 phage baseplate protein [Burkholderia vietnamiensis]KVS12936.1 phage baseplate protein [Burkholderia vietnamiensis]KVS43826.1 phage baseplate protein [Burkholderia vietnamiensis]